MEVKGCYSKANYGDFIPNGQRLRGLLLKPHVWGGSSDDADCEDMFALRETFSVINSYNAPITLGVKTPQLVVIQTQHYPGYDPSSPYIGALVGNVIDVFGIRINIEVRPDVTETSTTIEAPTATFTETKTLKVGFIRIALVFQKDPNFDTRRLFTFFGGTGGTEISDGLDCETDNLRAGIVFDRRFPYTNGEIVFEDHFIDCSFEVIRDPDDPYTQKNNQQGQLVLLIWNNGYNDKSTYCFCSVQQYYTLMGR